MGSTVKDFDETAIADNRLFDALDETTCRRVLEGGKRMTMPAGTPVFAPGDECQGLPLVIEGEIRVQMIGASGNEIVLYRIQGGEMCPLSLGCLLSRNSHQSEAIVEKDSEVLVLSPALTTELMDQAVCFRQAILESYGQRLQSLMLVIEEVAFRRLDERLAEKLVERQFQGQLAVTHQDLAVELGTAREVVSRLLKEFERRGLVRLERGCITISDRDALDRVRGETAKDRTA
ncbi:Crp/Fnr family transcriptional regulator [Spiribacter roseus]|uniref:Crp/Fnr family transcriptional regulator n=1 Tax=Spiribacter roseus TaxID=1855875 RepID=UPI001F44AE30|nr:Crp/Fnr family transcriptional regulator [Spiribacter roseus]